MSAPAVSPPQGGTPTDEQNDNTNDKHGVDHCPKRHRTLAASIVGAYQQTHPPTGSIIATSKVSDILFECLTEPGINVHDYVSDVGSADILARCFMDGDTWLSLCLLISRASYRLFQQLQPETLSSALVVPCAVAVAAPTMQPSTPPTKGTGKGSGKGKAYVPTLQEATVNVLAELRARQAAAAAAMTARSGGPPITQTPIDPTTDPLFDVEMTSTAAPSSPPMSTSVPTATASKPAEGAAQAASPGMAVAQASPPTSTVSQEAAQLMAGITQVARPAGSLEDPTNAIVRLPVSRATLMALYAFFAPEHGHSARIIPQENMAQALSNGLHTFAVTERSPWVTQDGTVIADPSVFTAQGYPGQVPILRPEIGDAWGTHRIADQVGKALHIPAGCNVQLVSDSTLGLYPKYEFNEARGKEVAVGKKVWITSFFREMSGCTVKDEILECGATIQGLTAAMAAQSDELVETKDCTICVCNLNC